MIYPLPALLVSCGATPEEYNVFTAAWTGTICSDPALCYVSIRPERYSHGIVERNMAFTLNLTSHDMARATDWCGVRSGRDNDKWPEAPVSIECRVRDIMRLGTHDMFIGEVVNVIADDRYIDPQTGALDLKAADLITYCHGHYYSLGDEIGHFGWSVRKKPKKD